MPALAAPSAELVEQVQTVARNLDALRRNIAELAAKQEKMSLNIAKLQAADKEIRQKLAAPRKTVPIDHSNLLHRHHLRGHRPRLPRSPIHSRLLHSHCLLRPVRRAAQPLLLDLFCARTNQFLCYLHEPTKNIKSLAPMRRQQRGFFRSCTHKS